MGGDKGNNLIISYSDLSEVIAVTRHHSLWKSGEATVIGNHSGTLAFKWDTKAGDYGSKPRCWRVLPRICAITSRHRCLECRLGCGTALRGQRKPAARCVYNPGTGGEGLSGIRPQAEKVRREKRERQYAPPQIGVYRRAAVGTCLLKLNSFS